MVPNSLFAYHKVFRHNDDARYGLRNKLTVVLRYKIWTWRCTGMLFVSGLFGSVKPAINKNISWGIELELSPDANIPWPLAWRIQEIPNIHPNKPKIQNLVILIIFRDLLHFKFGFSTRLKKGGSSSRKKGWEGRGGPQGAMERQEPKRHHRGNRFNFFVYLTGW